MHSARTWQELPRRHKQMAEPRKVLIDPLVDNNPVTLQVLGI